MRWISIYNKFVYKNLAFNNLVSRGIAIKVVIFSLFFSCLLFPALSYAEIYKWVDENGKLHFSDRPNTKVRQELVDVKTSQSTWKAFDIVVDLVECELSTDVVKQIKKDVNLVYSFYDVHLHFDIYKTVPVNIRIEKDKESYQKYVSRVLNEGALHSRGVFIYKLNQIVVYLQDDETLTLATIKHEVSHAIVKTLSPMTPRWLNEGLAEQMETLVDEAGTLRIYEHQENRLYLVKYQDSLIPLEEFLKLQSAQWHNKHMSVSAMQTYSGGLIYLLLSSSATGRPFVSRLLHYYSRGEKFLTRYVVDDLYTGGLDVMTMHWQAWIKKGGQSFIEL